MDKQAIRHIMATIIVSEELKVPNIRQGDDYMANDRLRKQFTALIQNTYCLVDLMLELGSPPPQQEPQQQNLQGPPY